VVLATPDHTHAAATIASIWAANMSIAKKPPGAFDLEVREIQRGGGRQKLWSRNWATRGSMNEIRMFCE